MPFTAHAQQATTLPSFTVVDLGPLNLDKGQTVIRKPSEMFADIQNPEMKKTLMLQNEITMINALTNWQSQVSKMEETYIEAGLPFTPPKPPRDICEQVPPNSVCGDAYSDLAPEKPAPAIAMPTISPSMPDPKLVTEDHSKNVDAPAEEAPPAYSWTDIRCKGTNCTAVLIDSANGNRISVMEGETVDDSVMVEKITADTVTLTVKGKSQKLPISDQPAQNFSAASTSPTGGSAALNSMLGDAPPSEQAMQSIEDSKTTPDPIVLDDGGSTGSLENDAAAAAAAAAANGQSEAEIGGPADGAAAETGLF